MHPSPGEYRAQYAAGHRKGLTLVEMIVVVAIIVVLLAAALPTLNATWDERKAADTETKLRGALASVRARALNDRERGLLFVVDPVTDSQLLYEIVADPYDPNDPADMGTDGPAASEQAAANRFRVVDTRVIRMPRPYRVVPRYVLEDPSGDPGKVWSEDELARTDYRASTDEAQRHRNFFTAIFRPDGELRVGRSVLIRDPDKAGDDDLGDLTGLPVADTAKWWQYDVDPPGVKDLDPVAGNLGLQDVLVDELDVAINFPSVDGFLVYSDAVFADQPTPADGRQHLIDRGEPLFVARLSGEVIRGTAGGVEED